MQLFVLAVVFVSVVSLVVGVYMLVNRRRLAMAEASRARLSPEAAAAAVTLLVKEESASDLPLLNRLLSGRGLTKELGHQLRRAGVTLKPGAFVLLTAVTTAAGALLGQRLGVAGMIVGGAIGAAVPFAWLTRRHRKRLAAFEEQLPNAIDMLVSALRSGYSFHAATNFLGQELAPPLGPEFARMYDEQRLGVDARTALLSFQERVGSVDIKMFVTALLIQRETGGNLSEVLTNTSTMIRERLAIRGHLQTLTAEAKYSGRVLALLPVLVFIGLSYFVPDFTKSFVTSALGQLMLAGAAMSVILGYAVMMKIADIDF